MLKNELLSCIIGSPGKILRVGATGECLKVAKSNRCGPLAVKVPNEFEKFRLKIPAAC